MASQLEETFRAWARGPSDTEMEKCKNAENMIRKAIAASDTLGEHKIEVFAQGSYRNRTNVRQDSDVDICVRCIDVFYSNFTFAEGATKQDAGIVDSNFTCGQFKNQVQNALVSYLGSDGVSRGDKAIGVHKNTYRIDADVVACFEHRRYVKNGAENLTYFSGTEFCPDSGGKIINWPHQHYDNGVAKNDITGKRFKGVVRILKRLRNKMAEENVAEADPIASYLLECLAWNTPNEGFGHEEYATDVRSVLAHGFHRTVSDEKCKDWREVNELKYLFRESQPWRRDQAHAFMRAAWNYVGFQS